MPLAKNVLWKNQAPGGKKCFIDRLCPWRQKGYKRVTPPGSFVFADLTPEGSHVSSHLVPGGNIFSLYHLVPGGNIFSLYHLVPGGIIFFTIWSLAATFFFIIWSLAAKYYFNLSIRIGVPFYIRCQNFLKIQCIPL